MPNVYETKVSSKRDSAGEFRVRLFKNGAHVKDADYFTPDRADAEASAKAMREHAEANQT